MPLLVKRHATNMSPTRSRPGSSDRTGPGTGHDVSNTTTGNSAQDPTVSLLRCESVTWRQAARARRERAPDNSSLQHPRDLWSVLVAPCPHLQNKASILGDLAESL